MAGRMVDVLHIVEGLVSDLLFVDGDIADPFFGVLVGAIAGTLDNFDALVLVQDDFGGYEEDFGEEILLF